MHGSTSRQLAFLETHAATSTELEQAKQSAVPHVLACLHDGLRAVAPKFTACYDLDTVQKAACSLTIELAPAGIHHACAMHARRASSESRSDVTWL